MPSKKQPQHANDDEDDDFFESFDRIPSSISVDITASSDDDEDFDDFDDPRLSFASAVAPPSPAVFSTSTTTAAADYNVWMSEPMSIKERRLLLLKGMGLSPASSRDLFIRGGGASSASVAATPSDSSQSFPSSASSAARTRLPSPPVILRSRSDVATLLAHSALIRRVSSAPSLLLSVPHSPAVSCRGGVKSAASLPVQSGSFFCRIKNLDTGKEFVVDEFGENDAWDRFSDLQTGRRLTVEEFERCVGYSPIIKELMRRETVGQPSSPTTAISCSPSINAAHSKSGKSVKKKGVGGGGGGSGVGGGNWLKNIREVANSVTGRIVETAERSSSFSSASLSTSSASELMKVHQHGKSYKELTGLYMSQEIQAHQGSIWTIRFSPDARYLASAGEDRVIHVWQVHECGVSESSSGRMDASGNPGRLRPPVLNGSLGRHGERKRRGKISSLSRRGSVPEYVVVPETIFSLSEKPVCSFQGHLDDVLDLSWSKSQHLLSSSMDKTVRLWNMESKTCLKLFAHNDYVTCIQFNPIDDRYFISGSLDAKVRIWSIPDRQVVDYTDLHEMVTAACYTPDGQGALVGSHKGSCRLYTTSGCKLRQKGQIDIQNKKKKSHAKKITGFQFAPGDPSEVLITSADSQIRVFDGVDIIHKFRGFRNTSSQLSASFTADGKYVVCASEDSQVYIWKRDELRQMSSGSSSGGGVKNKSWMTTRSHEHFHCRDVSVAIPWPGSSKFEPPPLPLRLMRHHHENHSRRNASSRSSTSSVISAQEDVFVSGRSHGSPLCKKNSSERALQNTEQDHRKPSYSESSISGISLASASRLLKSGVLSTISSSAIPPPSWWWYDGGSNRISSIQEPAAWGLVFVTAGLGGEIRVYQNFGLPLRLNRQATFF